MVQGWIDAGGTDPDDMAMKPPITLPSSTVSRNALVLIAVVAAGAAVYWLRGILTPLAMAIFLMIMIDGLKRGIETRTPVPGRWAGVAALLLVVLGFFASIAIITNGALNFFSEASGVSTRLGPRIDQILFDVSQLFGIDTAPTATQLIAQLDIRAYLGKFEELVTVPKWGRRLHRVVRDLHPDLAAYKGFIRNRDAMAHWLSQYDDGQPTSPGWWPED